LRTRTDGTDAVGGWDEPLVVEVVEGVRRVEGAGLGGAEDRVGVFVVFDDVERIRVGTAAFFGITSLSTDSRSVVPLSSGASSF